MFITNRILHRLKKCLVNVRPSRHDIWLGCALNLMHICFFYFPIELCLLRLLRVTAFTPLLEHYMPWCVCTNYVSDAGAKVLCNPERKRGVTAEQKLCIENKGELKKTLRFT